MPDFICFVSFNCFTQASELFTILLLLFPPPVSFIQLTSPRHRFLVRLGQLRPAFALFYTVFNLNGKVQLNLTRNKCNITSSTSTRVIRLNVFKRFLRQLCFRDVGNDVLTRRGLGQRKKIIQLTEHLNMHLGSVCCFVFVSGGQAGKSGMSAK